MFEGLRSSGDFGPDGSLMWSCWMLYEISARRQSQGPRRSYEWPEAVSYLEGKAEVWLESLLLRPAAGPSNTLRDFDSPKLVQKSQVVPLCPMLSNLAVSDSPDVHLPPLDRSACGRNTQEGAVVCTPEDTRRVNRDFQFRCGTAWPEAEVALETERSSEDEWFDRNEKEMLEAARAAAAQIPTRS